ncbi:MAG: hypothetical protein ABIN67_18635 [Ferruginibacter sp.]
MKSFINRIMAGGIGIYGSHNNKERRNKKRLRYAVVLLVVISLSSCFLHYYKVDRLNKADAATMQNLIAGSKYFILHANDKNLALTQVKINNDMLEGEVNPLPPEHEKYLNPKNAYANRFKVKDKDIVLYEVHLYTTNPAISTSHISIPMQDVSRVDIYELNQKATRKSRILSIVGLSAITFGTIVIIAAAIALDDWGNNDTYVAPSNNGNSNNSDWAYCSPQVYAMHGPERKLTGILYSGAIFAPLQRTDYMPLADVHPENNQFNLQIHGGQNEEQIIHETKLLQVTHGSDNNVLLDHHGKVLVYKDPAKPVKVFTEENEDAKSQVLFADESYYSFTNQSAGRNTSDIILDFKKPANITSAKLLVKAKNSAWGLYLFRKFKSLYGDSYPALVQQKDKADRNKLLQCELDQSLPLLVSVKAGNTWKFVDFFYTPGNQVLRDMIMEIDLSDFKDKDHVQVRLETTYMFWDLDYAGMDFSKTLSYETAFISPDKIVKCADNQSQGTDAIGAVQLSDKEHLNLGFSVKPVIAGNKVNSYFLVGTGYYLDNTRFEGKPQLAKLAAFSQKGAFDKFSRQTFDELTSLIKNNAANSVAAKN